MPTTFNCVKLSTDLVSTPFLLGDGPRGELHNQKQCVCDDGARCSVVTYASPAGEPFPADPGSLAGSCERHLSERNGGGAWHCSPEGPIGMDGRF